MVKYIGVKSAEDANRVREEFVREIEAHNRSVSKRRNVLALIVLGAVALIGGIVWLGIDSAMKENVFSISIGVLIAIEFAVFMGYNEDFRSDAEWFYPVAYKFFKATDGLEVLKTEIKYDGYHGVRNLWLTLKNDNNEVSHKLVTGFKSVAKTDINDTIVDLDEGVIYEPYKDWSVG